MSEWYSHAFQPPRGAGTELVSRRGAVPGGEDELFRSLFDRSGVCIAALDADQRVLEANADLIQLLDLSAQQVRGKQFVELLHPGIRSGTRKQLTTLLEEKRGRFSDHVAALRSDGSLTAATLTAVAVRGQNHTASALVLLNPSDLHNGGKVVVQQNIVLTDVDARILEGVAAGLSTVHIASRLNLSRTGVDYHVRAMQRKLKAANRPALIARAYTLGILSVATWPPRVRPDLTQ